MNIFKFIWNIIVAIGVLIGIIDGYDDAIDFFNENIYTAFNPLSLEYIKIVTPTFIFLISFTIYLINRTKFIVFFKSNLFSPIFIIKDIHEFQHIYDDIIDSIALAREAGKEVAIGDNLCRNSIFQLLSHIRTTLSTIGIDQTSVNIKIPVNTGTGGRSITDLDHAVLKTYERAPSPLEQALTSIDNEASSPKLTERSNKERFIISNDENATKWMQDNAGKCKKGHSRCNSAYIHVLGSGSHSWISNDLIKDKKKKQFLSTSTGWEKYYKSLAVVAIAPHQTRVNGCIDNSFGVLVADSPKRNAFNKKLVRKVLGYYAHRLYRLLKYIEFKD